MSCGKPSGHGCAAFPCAAGTGKSVRRKAWQAGAGTGQYGCNPRKYAPARVSMGRVWVNRAQGVPKFYQGVPKVFPKVFPCKHLFYNTFIINGNTEHLNARLFLRSVDFYYPTRLGCIDIDTGKSLDFRTEVFPCSKIGFLCCKSYAYAGTPSGNT